MISNWSIFSEIPFGRKDGGPDFLVIILQNKYGGPDSEADPYYLEFAVVPIELESFHV